MTTMRRAVCCCSMGFRQSAFPLVGEVPMTTTRLLVLVGFMAWKAIGRKELTALMTERFHLVPERPAEAMPVWGS